MKTYKFPACGCEVNVNNIQPQINIFGIPSLIYTDDAEELNHNCDVTWGMLGDGCTKGVFQLESPLGRQYAKKLKPTSILHMSALGALLRPGCIGGDTKVAIKIGQRLGRKIHMRKVTIRELYNTFTNNHFNSHKEIISLDEGCNLLFANFIENVTYSGQKAIYKLKFNGKISSEKFYHLECTLDHKLLTLDRGWQELKDIESGEYIAVIKTRGQKSRQVKNAEGEKHFRHICKLHYKYKCVMCDWNQGSLDVNHLEGNRKTNNSPSNLCFLCPNHHRMYTEGSITKEELIERRKQYSLPNTEHIEWRMLTGITLVGVKDTYDISVVGPNHNFIAGNVVVHNCLKAKDENGISMTDHFCLRKNGLEPVTYFHAALESLLNETYGVLTYQEQAMAIAVALAGFSPQEADDLRKAIGKKKTDVMAKVKTMFIEGCAKVGIVTAEQAGEIFGWIEKSQRYSFNKSHALCYGLLGYHTAHIKAHFPLQFFNSWLWHAKEKQDPLTEIRQLINDAKGMGIEVLPPRYDKLKYQFTTDGVAVTFGLSDVKGVGYTHIKKLRQNMRVVEKEIGMPSSEWSWLDFLIHFSPACNSICVKRMIEVGAMAKYPIARQRMLAEYNVYKRLTDTEQSAMSRLYKNGFVDNDEMALFNTLGKEPQKVESFEDGLQILLDSKKGVTKGRRDKVGTMLKLLKNPAYPLIDTPEWIAKTEKECLGIPLTYSAAESNPMIQADTTCKEYRDGKDTGTMVMAVDVQDFREIKIQNGQSRGRTMAFLTFADSTGCLEDVCMFADAWQKYSNIIFIGAAVEVSGRRDAKRGSFIVEEVWAL